MLISLCQKLIKVFVVAVAFVYVVSANASFERGLELYQEKKFDEAIVVFQGMAEIGDYSAMFNLGVMHFRAEATPQDKVLAYAWMHTAGTSLEVESYLNVAEKVWGSMTEEQQQRAIEKKKEFWDLYSPASIGNHIFPKLLSDEECESEPVPLKKLPPYYPRMELQSGKMGRVEIEFTVSQEGYVRDLVVNSATNRRFELSAVRAAKRFRYHPPLKDGVPAYAYGIRNLIKFVIAGNPTIKTKKLMAELESVKQKAQDGNPVAQYVYAERLNVFRSFQSFLQDLNLEYREANKWYLASATQGLPHAQFQIGRNMLAGRGCETDVVNGMKWIKAAAIGGYSPAQYFVAQSLIDESNDSAEQSVLVWLKNAALSDHYSSKLLLAWEYAASPRDGFRNGQAALELLSEEGKDYFDEVRILETKAAAYAELGKFKKAQKYQKRAIKEASSLGWEIPEMSSRLAAYEAENAWVGDYYPEA